MWLCGLKRSRRYVAPTEENAPRGHAAGGTQNGCRPGAKELDTTLPDAPTPESKPAGGLPVGFVSETPKPSSLPYKSPHLVQPSEEATQENYGRHENEEHWRVKEQTDAENDAGNSVLKTVLNQLCYPVTLIDGNAVVVLQNEASRRLWGDLVHCEAANKATASAITSMTTTRTTSVVSGGCLSPLAVLFASDREAYMEALQELNEGRVWRGLLQMPPTETLRALPSAPIAAFGSHSGPPAPLPALLLALRSRGARVVAAQAVPDGSLGPAAACARDWAPPQPAASSSAASAAAAAAIAPGRVPTLAAATATAPRPDVVTESLSRERASRRHGSGLLVTGGGLLSTEHGMDGSTFVALESDVSACLDTMSREYRTSAPRSHPSGASRELRPSLPAAARSPSRAAMDAAPLAPGSLVRLDIEPDLSTVAVGVNKAPVSVCASEGRPGMLAGVPGGCEGGDVAAAGEKGSGAHIASAATSPPLTLPPVILHAGHSWGSMGLPSEVMRGCGSISGGQGAEAADSRAVLEGPMAALDEPAAPVAELLPPRWKAVGLGPSLSFTEQLGRIASWPESMGAKAGETRSARMIKAPMSYDAAVMSMPAMGSTAAVAAAIDGRLSSMAAPAVRRAAGLTSAVMPAVAPHAPGESGSVAAAGRPSSLQASGSATQALHHQKLMAEGLTTSTLSTLVKGRGRRLPRRNISAAVLMSSSASYSGHRLNAAQLGHADARAEGPPLAAERCRKSILGGGAWRPGSRGSVGVGAVSGTLLMIGESHGESTTGDAFGHHSGAQSQPHPKLQAPSHRRSLLLEACGLSVGCMPRDAQSSSPKACTSPLDAAAVPAWPVILGTGDCVHPGSGVLPERTATLSANGSRTIHVGSASISQAASPGSHADSGLLVTNSINAGGGGGGTANPRPTSAMHRLLNMAFTVASSQQLAAIGSLSRRSSFLEGGGGGSSSARAAGTTQDAAGGGSGMPAPLSKEAPEALLQGVEEPPPSQQQQPRLQGPHSSSSRHHSGATRFGVSLRLPVQLPQEPPPSAEVEGAPSLPLSLAAPQPPVVLLAPKPSFSEGVLETAVLFRNMQPPEPRSACSGGPGDSDAGSRLSSRNGVPFTRDVDADRLSGRGGGPSFNISGTRAAAAAAALGLPRVASLVAARSGGNELTFANSNAPPRLSASALDRLLDTQRSGGGSGPAVQDGLLDTHNSGGTGGGEGGPRLSRRTVLDTGGSTASGCAGGVKHGACHSVQLCTLPSGPEACEGSAVAAAAGAAEAPPQPAAAHAQWYEVTLSMFTHPTLQTPVIMMVQNDVSARVWAERQVAIVMEAEHSLLEAIFPAHVLQHIAFTAAQAAEAEDAQGAAPTLKGSLSCAGGAATAAAAAVTAAGVLPSLPTSVHITGDTFLHLATSHSALTLLFCDIQGFTTMCNSVTPVTVMSFLNDLYTRLDAMLDAFGVYKVETIGDCYVAAGGLMKVDEETGAVTVRGEDVDPQHAHRTVQFAKALLRAASAVRLPTTGEPVRLRVGIHSGPAMSGVVGTRMPRFCLFGDTINTASRMESTGLPGAIHVSQATRNLVPDEPWEPTGGVQAKGKGMMETFLLRPPLDECRPLAGRA